MGGTYARKKKENPMKRHTFTTLGIGLLTAFTSQVQSEIINVQYDFPSSAGISFDWFFFGGDQGPVTGSVISTTLVIENYTVSAPLDASNFLMTFDVPVLDSVSEQIFLTGDSLGWSGTGSFSHSFTTDDYNGVIRPGRFGAQWLGGGIFDGDAFINFTVDTALVPAPGSTGLILATGLIWSRRRR
jgi:hypothetical protein